MKTQLRLAVFAATLFITAGSTEANDLRFAISTLQSAHNSYTHRAPARRHASTPAAPQRTAEPASQPLLLGAYLQDVDGGLEVTGTLSGSPASDVLRKGDVLRRVSALGQPTRTLDTLLQLNHAKREIGPNRQAALEVFRPGLGIDYVWVTFRPAGELATFSSETADNARSMFNNLNDNYVSR